MSQDQINALLAELERHKDHGRNERIAQIKDELAALGHRAGTVDDGPSDVMETAVDPGPAPVAVVPSDAASDEAEA